MVYPTKPSLHQLMNFMEIWTKSNVFHYTETLCCKFTRGAAPAAAFGAPVHSPAAGVVICAPALVRSALTLEVVAVGTPASAMIAVPSAAYAAPTVFPYRSAPYLAISAVLTLEYPVGAVPTAAAFVAAPVSAAPGPLSSAAYAAP